MLRFSLNLDGFLWLGPSEGVPILQPDLTITNSTWKLFKKIHRSNFPKLISSPLNALRTITPPAKEIAFSAQASDLLPQYAYDAILADVVSSGFILDASWVILHSIGQARELLTLPEGVPVLILPKIIHDDLKGSLITALHQAKETLLPVKHDKINVHQADGKLIAITMTVHPIHNRVHGVSYYWIRLEPTTPLKNKKQPISALHKTSKHDEDIILYLESELAETRLSLQSTLENMDSMNEEMQSTNEELMAANEELQSANEELQSVNQELYSVNMERSAKIEEVVQSKTDLDNLISSADICTIILNSALEIRLFTPAAEKIFNLMNHDVGRPLKNFKHNLKLKQLMATVANVIKTNAAYESEVSTNDNYWYFLKINPYHSNYNQAISGVVISLTDINTTKRLQEEKTELEKNLSLALKTGLIGIWHYNIDESKFTYDKTLQTILGLTMKSKLSVLTDFTQLIHPDDRKKFETAFSDTVNKQYDFELKFRIIRTDDSIRYLSCSANPHHNKLTGLHHITGICWDMTDQYWLDEKIIDAEHLNLKLDHITDGWWFSDLLKKEFYLSPLIKKTLGYKDYELPNQQESYEQLIYPEDHPLIIHKMKMYLLENKTEPMINTYRMQHKNGSLRWILDRTKGIPNKQGQLIRIIGTITDITPYQEAIISMEKLAHHDYLTQIPNRPAFIFALTHAIERAKRNKAILAVMFIDIDDFKIINDTWGHTIGDAVLCEFTHRLAITARTVDLSARLGGDEFGVLLEDIKNTDELFAMTTRYLDAFKQPLIVNKLSIDIKISIGVAVYPQHGKTSQELLLQADKKMYLAKGQGKNQFVL